MIASNREPAKVSAREARQVLFALAIATGKTTRQAGKSAGISEATAYRWAGNADVAKLANNFRARVIRETIGQMAASGSKAMMRLSSLIDSTNESIALKASITVVSEIRRIGESSSDRQFSQALRVVSDCSNEEPAFDLGFLLDFSERKSEDDEPIPEPPLTYGLSKREANRLEKDWAAECEEVLCRNRERRESKRLFEEHQRNFEAEARSVSVWNESGSNLSNDDSASKES